MVRTVWTKGVALIACCSALACSSSASDGSKHGDGNTGGGGVSAAGSPTEADPTEAGQTGVVESGGATSINTDPGQGATTAADGGNSGASPLNLAGASGASTDIDPEDGAAWCDIGSSCALHQCTPDPVSCDVVSIGFACEFEEFVGASAPIMCGQRVTVGTSCCGACGCMPVELFFDGRKCWQGIPQCEGTLNNRFYGQHDPGPPTSGIYVPSNGGQGGSLGSGGQPNDAAGESSGGEAGTTGGGANSAAASGLGESGTGG